MYKQLRQGLKEIDLANLDSNVAKLKNYDCIEGELRMKSEISIFGAGAGK